MSFTPRASITDRACNGRRSRPQNPLAHQSSKSARQPRTDASAPDRETAVSVVPPRKKSDALATRDAPLTLPLESGAVAALVMQSAGLTMRHPAQRAALAASRRRSHPGPSRPARGGGPSSRRRTRIRAESPPSRSVILHHPMLLRATYRRPSRSFGEFRDPNTWYRSRTRFQPFETHAHCRWS